MEERSLRITGTNTNFFNRLTKTLTKLLIPTKIGINGMLITLKRNNLIKAFENYKKDTENYNTDELEKKYDEAYTVYLEALDKYVMDSIYKKVKNNTATEFERDALSRYYEVTSLKEKEYMDYKYRKQKYLLELDKESVDTSAKEKVQEKYNKFYVDKMDTLYKAILKNYSIKLADTTNIYDTSKEWIYVKIFYTLEEYIKNILPLKMEINPKEDFKDIIEDYEKLLKDARILVQDTKMAAKREKAYAMLINLIEDYNVRLLSTKVYWEDIKERENYKKYWDKYKKISALKEVDFVEYMKQKEILFIKNDMKKLNGTKVDYSKLIKYYRRKLVDYGVIKELKNEYKSEGKYIGKIRKEDRVVA